MIDDELLECGSGSLSLDPATDRFIASTMRAGRRPILMSEPGSTLTWPLRQAVTAGDARWLVTDESAQMAGYDGITGEPLLVRKGVVTNAGVKPHPAFAGPVGSVEPQLIINATVQHRAAANTEIGGAIEELCRRLTGSPPIGWGRHEPVTEAWNVAALTQYVRQQMPGNCSVVVGGDAGSFVATVRVSRTDRGIDEDVSALVRIPSALTAGDCSARALSAAAGRVAIAFALASAWSGRPDLTFAPTRYALPSPVALYLGPRAVRAIGSDLLMAAPLRAPESIGHPRAPGFLWHFDTPDGWNQIADLVSHVGPERIAAADPNLKPSMRLT